MMVALANQGFIAIGAILCAIIGYFLGVTWKGRPILGTLLGFFLGFIGLLIFCIIPKSHEMDNN